MHHETCRHEASCDPLHHYLWSSQSLLQSDLSGELQRGKFEENQTSDDQTEGLGHSLDYARLLGATYLLDGKTIQRDVLNRDQSCCHHQKKGKQMRFLDLGMMGGDQ